MNRQLSIILQLMVACRMVKVIGEFVPYIIYFKQ